MADHDVVIRAGTVIDGTGAPARTADVAITAGRITEVGAVEGRGRREVAADGPAGHAGLRRHPQPLRRSGHLGQPAAALGVARRHHRRDGQLRRRLRARAPGRSRPAHRADGRRRGHPGHGAARRPRLVVAELRRVPRRARSAAPTTSTSPPRCRTPRCACTPWATGAPTTPSAPPPTRSPTWAGSPPKACEAGGLGFTTSRTKNHRSIKGEYTPSLTAEHDELVGIASALGRINTGVLQVVSDFVDIDEEAIVLHDMAATGRPLSISLAAGSRGGSHHKRVLAAIDAMNAEGLEVRAQVAARGIGILLGLQATMNPFTRCPSYREVAGLPLPERVAALREPSRRAAIVAEQADFALPFEGGFERMFALGDPPDYEPDPDTSIAAEAAAHRPRRGRPRLRPHPRRRGPRPALLARSSTTRTATSTSPASSSSTRPPCRASATAAPTWARSATAASPPRCSCTGAATARGASSSTSRSSCSSSAGRRPAPSGCSTAACWRRATAPT